MIRDKTQRASIMGGNVLGDKVSWLSGGGVKKDVRPNYNEPGSEQPVESVDMDTQMKSNKRKLKKKIGEAVEKGADKLIDNSADYVKTKGKKKARELIDHFINKKKIKTI